jgi:predicted amidohydrolase
MKIGLAQINLYESIEKNRRKIIDYISFAKEKEVRILCFPETALSGYLFDGFLNLNYEELERELQIIKEVVKGYGITVILGTPLKVNNDLYNSAVIIYPDSRVLQYSKRNLVSYEEAYFKPGKERMVFDVDGLRFGVIICRDQNDPLLSRELKKMGAMGIFICSAHYYDLVESKLKRDKNIALPIARAYENSLYVFKSNAIGTIKGRISYGNSIIVDPNGVVVLKASEKDEELLVYDV